MIQINPNEKATLEQVKSIMESSKIDNGILLLNPEHFKEFRWLLNKVTNVFFNSTKEAQQYIKSFAKENNVRKSKFEYIPDWAK